MDIDTGDAALIFKSEITVWDGVMPRRVECASLLLERWYFSSYPNGDDRDSRFDKRQPQKVRDQY